MKRFLHGVFLGLLAWSSFAADVALKDNHPTEYVVKKGDTLWDISSTFLSEPWYWPEIWHMNPAVENPHLIFPGDVLSLVYVDGKPRIVAQRGDASRTVVMSPGADGDRMKPRVRTSPIDNAIPAIPLDKINAFLSRSRIIEDDSLSTAPYVIAGSTGRILSGAGDRLYARGKFDENEKIYGIYREGRIYVDPETKETLGMEATDIGGGKAVSFAGDVATIQMNSSREEVRIKDRLLPYGERKVTATFMPSAPQGTVDGLIVGVEGGVTQVGTMDVVTLNKGEREGLEVGNVLAIYKAGEVVRDQVTNDLIQLPDVRAGLLMVFRSFNKMSYAIVLNANQPLEVLDKVRNP
jgi:nucleoid-associated protein YgaU